MVDENRPTTWITTALILCLTFLGCATPASQQPQKNRKSVDLKIPEIGTEAHWRIVTNGEETILSGVFVKEKIDGILSYYWKNQEREITSVFDSLTLNFMGKWSHINKEWLSRANPHIGNKQYPLWAGKKYWSVFFYSSKNGWSGRVDSLVTVEDWETVTVPAGSFETLRIIQGNQNFSLTYWYDPELGMDVKFSSSGIIGERSWEVIKIITP